MRSNSHRFNSVYAQLETAFAGLLEQLESRNHHRDALHRKPIDICQDHNLWNCRKKVCLKWSTSAANGLGCVASKTIRRPRSEPLFFHNMYKCQLLDYDCWVWGLSLANFLWPGVVVWPTCGKKEFDQTRSVMHVVAFGRQVRVSFSPISLL